MIAETLPKPHYILSSCTSRHSLYCKSACAPRGLCSWTKQPLTGLPSTPAARVSQRSRLALATRTAVGVSEEPEPDDFPPEALTNFNSGKARRTSSAAKKPTKLQLASPSQINDWLKQGFSYELKTFKGSVKASFQLLQLFVLVSLLIIVPAVQLCGNIPQQADHLGIVYLLFFGFGSVRRLLMYGKLAPRKQDAQVQKSSGKLSLVVFILMIVAGHWLSMAWFAYCLRNHVAFCRHPVIQAAATSLLAGGLALHVWAAACLGKAYDRLVRPDKLVREGPYAWCQHPIYTSYIMLFMGYALYLGSLLTCLLFHQVCIWYYLDRTKKESVILAHAFGNDYRVYAEHTGRFVPRLL